MHHYPHTSARQRASPAQPTLPAVLELHEIHGQFVAEQRFSTRLSPATLRGYRQSLAILVSVMPTITVQELTPASMTEFFRRLETRTRRVGRGKERRGVKTSTVAAYRSKLNRFFAWLKLKGHIDANPFDSMPYPNVQYADRKFLSRRTVERIFSVLALGGSSRTRFLRRRNSALFATLLYTGMRRGELLGLRLTDLDLNRLHVTIRAETSKSRLERAVPVNSKLFFAISDYLEERRRHGLQCEYLFTSASGDQPLTSDGLKHLVQQVKRLSGVSFHVHQFRHTFAVNFLNRGGDIAKLKQLLGHRDIRMTSAYLRCLPTSAMRTDVESISLDSLL